jgi:hypothetical protein
MVEFKLSASLEGHDDDVSKQLTNPARAAPDTTYHGAAQFWSYTHLLDLTGKERSVSPPFLCSLSLKRQVGSDMEASFRQPTDVRPDFCLTRL